MKQKFNFKNGMIIGSILILIAIAIGIIFQHDIGFVFAGIGIVIIGISILTYINKGNNQNWLLPFYNHRNNTSY